MIAIVGIAVGSIGQGLGVSAVCGPWHGEQRFFRDVVLAAPALWCSFCMEIQSIREHSSVFDKDPSGEYRKLRQRIDRARR